MLRKSEIRNPHFVLCLLLVGCGSPPSEPSLDVTGAVRHGDQPVTNAVIYFEQPSTAYSVWADLNEQGQYQNPKLPPGKYQIAIKPKAAAPAEGDPNTEPTQPAVLKHPLVPEKFHDSATSGLTANVQLGAPAIFDFDLSK